MVYLSDCLNLSSIGQEFATDAEQLKIALQKNCWDERDGFFYSVDLNLRPVADQLDHTPDVLRRPGGDSGALDAKPVHVVVGEGDAAVGPVPPFAPLTVNLDQAADTRTARHGAGLAGFLDPDPIGVDGDGLVGAEVGGLLRDLEAVEHGPGAGAAAVDLE